MDPIFILGLAAATLTTTALLPQAIKAHNSKHTKDISLAMFAISAVGVFLWMIYGFYIASFPVIIANSVTFCLMSYIVYLKIKYG